MKQSKEFKNFDSSMRELLKVPHSEIASKIQAEKQAKKRKKSRKSSASDREVNGRA